jgi:hypothetical protein
MIVATNAIPAYFKETELEHSANGIGEGYSALDRFRCLGHPLEKRRGQVDLNISPTRKAIFETKITSNDKDFGSSDAALLGVVQESLTITSDGQTAFQLSNDPADVTTVMLFARGVKLTYGIDYTIGGPGLNDNDITYIPSFPTNPPLVTTDTLEAWYVAQ